MRFDFSINDCLMIKYIIDSIIKRMNFNFLPHPPNSAWLPPLDPNDEVLPPPSRKP